MERKVLIILWSEKQKREMEINKKLVFKFPKESLKSVGLICSGRLLDAKKSNYPIRTRKDLVTISNNINFWGYFDFRSFVTLNSSRSQWDFVFLRFDEDEKLQATLNNRMELIFADNWSHVRAEVKSEP